MSQLEVEHFITKAKQVRNHAEGGQLVRKATRYLTHAEKENKQEELRRVQETLDPSNVAIGSLTQEGRAGLVRYKNQLERDLRENVAPQVPAAIKDDLIRVEREMAEQIRQGMLPVETMRRNPPGSVSHHMKWERENKEKILTWKNLRRMNHPDDDSEDLANIELLRPSESVAGQSVPYHADAQIPGHFAMSALAKENWPENMPEYGEVNSPYKQAVERENQELKEQLAALQAKVERLADSQLAAVTAQRHPGVKRGRRYQKREPGVYVPFVCQYVLPSGEPCRKEFDIRQKGVHLASHARMERDLRRAEEELHRLEAERAKGE